MINIQCSFRTIAKSVRHYLSDYGLRVIEQNHRFFAKATSFPCVLLVERTFGDLGRFKVSVVGESIDLGYNSARSWTFLFLKGLSSNA